MVKRVNGINTSAMLVLAGKPGYFDHNAPQAKKKRIIRTALIVTGELNLIKQQQEIMRLYLLDCEQKLAELMAYREGLAQSSTPVTPDLVAQLDSSIKQIKQDIDGVEKLLENSFITMAGLELYANATNDHERALAVVAINVDKVQATANTNFITAVKQINIQGISPAQHDKVVTTVTQKLNKQPAMVKVVDVVQRSQQQHAAANAPQSGPSAIPAAPRPQPGKSKNKDAKVQQVYVNKRALNMELYLTSALLKMTPLNLRQTRSIIRSNPDLMTAIKGFQNEMQGMVDNSDSLEEQLQQSLRQHVQSNGLVVGFHGKQQNTNNHIATANNTVQAINQQQSTSYYENLSGVNTQQQQFVAVR